MKETKNSNVLIMLARLAKEVEHVLLFTIRKKKFFHIQVERFQLVSLTIIIRSLQVCFCVNFLRYERCCSHLFSLVTTLRRSCQRRRTWRTRRV